MINFGLVPAGAVLPIFFDAFAGSTGASVTISGLAVTDIEVYKGTSTTQRSSDNGYALIDTDGIDIDGITGIHGFSIDTGDNTDAGFYAVGSFFTVVVSAITVDGQTVNFVAATFRMGTAEGVTGQPKVDVAAFGGSAGTFSIGRPEVNTTHAAGTAWGSGAITASSIAADAITAAKIADGAIDAATFAADAKGLFAIVDSGTAQSVTGTTIVLRAAAAFADSELIGATVFIVSATTGAGQSRVITANVGATDTATVDAWMTTPTGTITYVVIGTAPYSATAVPDVNVTKFGGTTVTGRDIGASVLLSNGTGAGQVALSSGTVTAGTVSDKTGYRLSATGVDDVWDEATAGHAGAGTTGKALTDAGSAGDPWATALPGAYGAGEAGFILGTNLDVTVGSRLATAGYTAPLSAAGTRTAVGLASANLDTQIGTLATAAALTTVDDFLDTEVAAIKAKTDNLPAAPAAVGDIPTAVQNADALLGRNVAGGSSAGRLVKEALYVLRNKIAVAGGTLTVYEVDDSTTAFTATVTTTAGDPVSGVDPA